MNPISSAHETECLANAETIRVEQAATVASKLCHDFGNYLTGIMGFTELSLQQAPPGGTLQRFLGEVLQSAHAGADWIQRLHRFCRRLNFPGWPAGLELAIAEAQARLSRENRTNLEWAIDLPAGLPMVGADAESLDVILSELTANTCQACSGNARFTMDARTVSLSATDCAQMLGNPAPGDYVEWNVRDNGPAIAPTVREKLFNELFFSTKPKHRGLGLWMIYGVLKRNGGGVKLACPELGFGVSMVLPVAMIPTFGPCDDGPVSVLVTLADSRQSRNMARLLEASGCTPTIASSPLEAHEMLINEPNRFTIAVIEIQLGHESGLSLARRTLEKKPSQRFVFLHSQISYHELPEEDLVKRFPVLRGPLEMATFFHALADAIRASSKKGK